MPGRPPFYRQETKYSCGPACLRMVLASSGIEVSEEELRDLSLCYSVGVDDFMLVEAARKKGFRKTLKGNLTLDELKDELKHGLYPIVYIKRRSASGFLQHKHSIVVVEISEDEVHALDPDLGEIKMPLSEFAEIWQRTRGFTILVK